MLILKLHLGQKSSNRHELRSVPQRLLVEFPVAANPRAGEYRAVDRPGGALEHRDCGGPVPRRRHLSELPAGGNE